MINPTSLSRKRLSLNENIFSVIYYPFFFQFSSKVYKALIYFFIKSNYVARNFYGDPRNDIRLYEWGEEYTESMISNLHCMAYKLCIDCNHIQNLPEILHYDRKEKRDLSYENWLYTHVLNGQFCSNIMPYYYQIFTYYKKRK
jgi:hypothetical protein